MKLTVDLLPRGAWGRNLSRTLRRKDWERLRDECLERARHRCVVCWASGRLDAHEVWEFDIEKRVQRLEDIVALCKSCHWVKHMRFAERSGFGKHAREHFLRVNRCGLELFVAHYLAALDLFERRSGVEEWEMDLGKFGLEVYDG